MSRLACAHNDESLNMETAKSHDRRVREGWFGRYVSEPVIDIGCGNDPLTPHAAKYDRMHGQEDAVFCREIPAEAFKTVYASHVLEHVWHPVVALQSWARILKPGGRIIVCVPHRNLYEKRQLLPSRWNGDHKLFFLPTECDPPHTFSLFETFRQALPTFEIELFRVLDDGYQENGTGHAGGEYSIEIIGRKPK